MNKAISILSLILSIMALSLGGATAARDLVDGGEIKNGSITAKDLKRNSVTAGEIRKNAVRSSDLKADSVTSSDIGEGAVMPEQLDLPAPTQTTAEPTLVSAAPDGFSKVADVATYTKTAPDSILQVEWSGAVAGGHATACVFQLRVNGQPSPRGGGEVYATESPTSISTTVLFPGLAVGVASVEVWARVSSSGSLEPTCNFGPGNPGIANTFIVSEAIS